MAKKRQKTKQISKWTSTSQWNSFTQHVNILYVGNLIFAIDVFIGQNAMFIGFFSLCFLEKKNNNTTTATQNKLQCYTLQCANRHVETHRLWCKKQVYSCSFTVSTFLFFSSLLLSFNSLCYDLLVDFLSFMWFFHYFDISIAHATILTFMQVFVDWKKMNLAWYCDCQSIIQLMGFNSVNSIILRFIEWRKCWNIVHRVQFNI